MVSAYFISWRHKGQAWLLDVNTPGLAAVISILLTETHREDVKVTEEDYQPDPEMAARVMERIKERINEEWATGVKTA